VVIEVLLVCVLVSVERLDVVVVSVMVVSVLVVCVGVVVGPPLR